MEIDNLDIINKTFLNILPLLTNFIGNTLKEKDSKNWWKNFVIKKLSETSISNLPKEGLYEECINSLDILACLNIIKANWHDIFKSKVKNSKYLSYIHEMISIRNDSAHPNIETIKMFTNEYVSRFIDTLILIMEPIDKNVSLNLRNLINNNENTKIKNRRTKKEDKLSELQSLQLEYWKYLEKYFYQKKMKVRLGKPIPRHYNIISIGKANYSICLTIIIEKNQLGCELYISGNNSKKAFFELIKEKEIIEKELKGKNLEWNELPNKKATRIRMYYDGNIKEKKEWNNISEWFKENTELLYEVFYKRIKRIVI